MTDARCRTKVTLTACLLLALGVFVPSPARAGNDLEFDTPPTSGDLGKLGETLSSAIGSSLLTPADNLGLFVFDAGVSALWLDAPSNDFYWNNAFGGDGPSGLASGTARVRLGLPARIDLGAHASWVGDSNIRGIGGDVKWTFLKDRPLVPAMAVRVDYSKLQGVKELGLDVIGADVSISKKIAFFTPYAGIGAVYTTCDAHDLKGAQGFRASSSDTAGRAYAGARFSLLFFKLTAEAQRTGDASSYAVRFAFVFP